VRWRLLIPVGGLALSSLLAPIAAAATISITQDTGDVAVDASTAVAQTFRTGAALRLVEVGVKVADGGSSADVTISVFATSGGKPTGSALVSDTTSIYAPDSRAYVTLPSAALAASTTYALEILTTGGATIYGTCTESYANGAALFQVGGDWVTQSASGTSPDCIQDLAFEVYGASVPSGTLDQHQYSLSNGYWARGVVAQTFTAGATGTLRTVSLWTEGAEASDTFTVALAICAVEEAVPACSGGGEEPARAAAASAGPTSTPMLSPGFLAVQQFAVSAEAYGWVDFSFADPPSLTAGTTYAIAWLAFDAAFGFSGNAASYGAGAAFRWGEGWNSINGEPPATPRPPESTARLSHRGCWRATSCSRHTWATAPRLRRPARPVPPPRTETHRLRRFWP
jgi:hypothetical protein